MGNRIALNSKEKANFNGGRYQGSHFWRKGSEQANNRLKRAFICQGGITPRPLEICPVLGFRGLVGKGFSKENHLARVEVG